MSNRSEALLPVHPLTGLTAIGMGKRGPIWPVMGGAPEEGEVVIDPADPVVISGESEEITPPESNDWWQFASKDDATTWGNKLVTDRLTRFTKSKLDPIVTERDTLKSEVERLKPLEDATKTDIQKRDDKLAEITPELETLRKFKADTERTGVLTSIAAEEGLDPKFLALINTDGDEDEVRGKIKVLLDALSESGANTGKKTPTPKAPKETGKPAGKPSQGGGGGNEEESDDAMAASILEQIRKDRANGGLRARR